MSGSRLWTFVLPSLVVAGCGNSTEAVSRLPPCVAGAGQAVALGVGQYAALDPEPAYGCFSFAANGSATDTTEYLLVAQAATGTPGATSPFAVAPALGGGVAAVTASVSGAPAAALQRPSPALEFHTFLRRAEESRFSRFLPAGPVAAAPPPRAAELAPLVPAAPPPVGDQRSFNVCSNLTCTTFRRITATAKTVGTHLAIYVDDAAPVNGLNQADLDTLSSVFDARLYGIDSAAFGAEPDVDRNAVVIVLMTPVVNSLVPRSQCDTAGFVAGFFFGADIDPRLATDNRFNHAEIVYSLVADPDSTLSCKHTRDQVKQLVPITFVHEFQHMISFNQHVIVRGGSSEVLWLNEALSHFAEELGGRSYLPGDNAKFSAYISGNLFNAYQYLSEPQARFLLADAGIGTLAERGAQWLFSRFLADQHGDSITRKLVQTTLTGAANVAAQTNKPFAQLVNRWILANWVSDLPGFSAPADVKYGSWAFRTTFASLNAQRPTVFKVPFPMLPGYSEPRVVNLNGTLRAGSGFYYRILQAPGAPRFGLFFTSTGDVPLSPTIVPRLNVIRIR